MQARFEVMPASNGTVPAGMESASFPGRIERSVTVLNPYEGKLTRIGARLRKGLASEGPLWGYFGHEACKQLQSGKQQVLVTVGGGLAACLL